MKRIELKRVLTEEEGNALAGKFLGVDSFDLLIDEDCDAFDADTGQPIFSFRKGIIPEAVCSKAWDSLRPAARPSFNRGVASGSDTSQKYIRKDGVESNTQKMEPVNSGIVGYYDRYVRTPYCRLTAYTSKYFERFREAYPVIKFVDNLYAEIFPEQYAKQRAKADETSQDFVIRGTSFTTVTVNLDYQTAVHKDAGDFPEGFGNLVVMNKGHYEGGYFVLPEWRVAIDARWGDLLLADVHQWHGNTPMHKHEENAERLSLVMYYRDNMIKCGTMEEELDRAKRRQQGDKLYD